MSSAMVERLFKMYSLARKIKLLITANWRTLSCTQ